MKINVEAYTMTPSSLTVGTEGSRGTALLEFHFSKEWADLIRKISFYTPTGNVVVILDGDSVIIPDEVMDEAGDYPFALSGYGDGKTLLSLTGKLTVLPTRDPAVTPPGSPTPTEMEQIYEMMEKAIRSNEAAAEAAETANAAAGSALAAAGQANAATADALAAAGSAEDAAREAGSSIVSATVNKDGHLILTFAGGSVQDAGSVRGRSVEGSYIGTGALNGGEQTISLGFRPALLAITRSSGGYVFPPTACVLFGQGILTENSLAVDLTDDGFTVYWCASELLNGGFNESGCEYQYMALSESIPTDTLSAPLDTFNRTDDDTFTRDCRESLTPTALGQLMIGPGGRLFVSLGAHELEGNQYGKWLPIIDDSCKSAAPSVITYSAEKIAGIADGLSRSMANMGQGLGAAISSLGAVLNTKATLVDGNLQMHGQNAMGFVGSLNQAEDDPNLQTEAGIYGVSTIHGSWASNALPAGESTGILEVLPTAAGLVVQRFFSASGKFYFRLKDLVHAYDWTSWKQLATV